MGLALGRRLLVPEVVQTSAMDCGPATLTCLLGGFGIWASYGRLREACQTDIDGTSIDAIEEAAWQLGLEAEQIMLPADHLLLPEARTLPGIVVVSHPDGVTHFVLAWRRHGRLLQIMDPASGRRWLPCHRFLEQVYIHALSVPVGAWLHWATSAEFRGALARRLGELGLSPYERRALVDVALARGGWRPLATFDAATRMLDSVVRGGGLRHPREVCTALDAICRRALEADQAAEVIPDRYWSVRPAAPGSDGSEQVLVRGAVVVRALGRRAPGRSVAGSAVVAAGLESLSAELEAATREPPPRPWWELLRLLRADGVLVPAAVTTAVILAAAGTVIEALLFRGLFELGRALGLSGQRLVAIGTLLLFVLVVLLLDYMIAIGTMGLGRRLEARLRLAFLAKLPRLADRYFQSRLTSDMAERSHSLHSLRMLPGLGGALLRATVQLILTAGGIAWLDPSGTPLAVLGAVVVVGLPLAAHPILSERDLRERNLSGALSRFYLDALLGLTTVRTHRAEHALRRKHQQLLAKWARAGFAVQRVAVIVEGVQALAGFGLAAWFMFGHVARAGEAGTLLLMAYWALNLPVLGREVALLARQYPAHRNIALRILEPLGAPEEPTSRADVAASRLEPTGGVTIALENVDVRVAGRTILRGINLVVDSSRHLAIVGLSGAGKSTLVGLLLGWHRPASGRVVVDGAALDSAGLERLRRQTVWVDPAVYLWNRSLFDNLRYGTPADASLPLGDVIEAARLRDLLEKLPHGLQSNLGEGGGLTSGGEGQRVRFGRGVSRPSPRLVILDEPFRGLDREQRRALLVRARALWRDATLICVTHDIEETHHFEFALVMENGRIVDRGSPAEMADKPTSRYRALLDAAVAVRRDLRSDGSWRALTLERGVLVEAGPPGSG